jgi:hypothetical protein
MDTINHVSSSSSSSFWSIAVVGSSRDPSDLNQAGIQCMLDGRTDLALSFFYAALEAQRQAITKMFVPLQAAVAACDPAIHQAELLWLYTSSPITTEPTELSTCAIASGSKNTEDGHQPDGHQPSVSCHDPITFSDTMEDDEDDDEDINDLTTTSTSSGFSSSMTASTFFQDTSTPNLLDFRPSVIKTPYSLCEPLSSSGTETDMVSYRVEACGRIIFNVALLYHLKDPQSRDAVRFYEIASTLLALIPPSTVSMAILNNYACICHGAIPTVGGPDELYHLRLWTTYIQQVLLVMVQNNHSKDKEEMEEEDNDDDDDSLEIIWDNIVHAGFVLATNLVMDSKYHNSPAA